ncbi:dockerin type I domain-containing protein [Neorhodopirellula lusitana]|uniref:dockerin type I domain-containing protein n=1 Tax=Neorhodopirellula lusitana TaxID=445327 RepID=UPI00384C7408
MARFWNLWIGRRTPARRKNLTKRTSLRRRPRPENLETRQLLAANIFHNEAMPEDVNEDGIVSAIDALTIVNQMNRQGINDPTQADDDVDQQRGQGRMTDVNNDGRDSALDALMVINRLNRDEGRFDTPSVDRDDTSSDNDSDSNIPTDQDPVVTEQDADAVLLWNDVFGDVLAASTENQNPGYASRSNAILNLAIFDSVAIASGNADGTFYDYDSNITNFNANVSSEVVATGAAYTALSELYPDQQAQLDAALEDSLAALSSREDPSTSLALGEEVANQILALRVDDGSDIVGEYTYTDEIGYFQADPLNPDVPAWGLTWGEVDTFAISSTDEFIPETTPALTSEAYAESYNEVLELGSVDSTERTADQTEAGIFWAYDREGLGTPLALFGDVLESVATQEGNTFEENVALFAQASVAMADAAIVAWDTKFSEEFWRPITAIQQGDADGNDLTEGDADWTSLGAPDGGDDIIGFTPQFPTYISGHATFGGALFGTLQEFYGTDDISFDVTSEELEILLEDPELQEAYGLDLDDATRSFDSFSEAMAENGRSRVYLGIHFDFDDLVGQEVGQAIAASVAEDFAALNDGTDSPDSTFTVSGTVVAATESVDRQDFSSNLVSDLDVNLLAQDQVDRLGNNQPNQDRDRSNDNRDGDPTEGIEGVTVELLDSLGTPVAQTTTDANGRYTFDSISDAGAYQIQIAASDQWTIIGDDIREVLLSEATDNLNRINFQVSLA